MTPQTKSSPAELADRTTLAVALVMFIVALLFAISVAEHFAADGLANVLDLAGKGLAALVILLVIAAYAWKFRRMSASDQRAYLAEDGFLQTSFRRALSKSWMLVFVVLAFLQALDNLLLSRLPAIPIDVVLQSVLALMLVAFSVAFAVIVGLDNAESDDDLPADAR